MIGRYRSIPGRVQRLRLSSGLRGYASTPSKPRKDLPPPLPPKASSSSSSSHSKVPHPSPAKAKKEYLAAQKKTGEFLRDPQANLARLQAEMDETKAKLLKVHDKPIWRRIVDRIRAKQHAAINLFCASLAYILAYRLHLQMKENEKLEQRIEDETARSAELRSLLRSVTSENFSRDVVLQATASTATQMEVNEGGNETKSSLWFRRKQPPGSSSIPENDLLVSTLHQKLNAIIGNEGLEATDRKEKEIRDIWKENEQKVEENSEEGLASLAAAIAAEAPSHNARQEIAKKRVFDM